MMERFHWGEGAIGTIFFFCPIMERRGLVGAS
jgi:hypothetical protein